VSFFTGAMPFLSPNQEEQSTEGLMDISFYRRQDARPAANQQLQCSEAV